MQDTSDRAETIKNLRLKGVQMLSPDLTSPFTNVSISKPISYICRYIEDNSISLGIPLDDLKQPLFVYTKSARVQFSGEICRQKDGMGVRSLLEPLFVYRKHLVNTSSLSVVKVKMCDLSFRFLIKAAFPIFYCIAYWSFV